MRGEFEVKCLTCGSTNTNVGITMSEEIVIDCDNCGANDYEETNAEPPEELKESINKMERQIYKNGNQSKELVGISQIMKEE